MLKAGWEYVPRNDCLEFKFGCKKCGLYTSSFISMEVLKHLPEDQALRTLQAAEEAPRQRKRTCCGAYEWECTEGGSLKDAADLAQRARREMLRGYWDHDPKLDIFKFTVRCQACHRREGHCVTLETIQRFVPGYHELLVKTEHEIVKKLHEGSEDSCRWRYEVYFEPGYHREDVMSVIPTLIELQENHPQEEVFDGASTGQEFAGGVKEN